MKWYKLAYKITDFQDVLSSVTYDDKYVRHDLYPRLITNRKFWVNDEPLFLWLYDGDSVSSKLYDIMEWTSGKPKARIWICSEKNKNVLSSLRLPPHRFYSAKIRIGSDFEDAWVFHYLFDFFSYVNFSVSQFYLRKFDSNKTLMQYLSAGYVRNLAHLTKIDEEQIENNLCTEPKKLVFQNIPTYDLWSLYGQHIISKKAMLLFKEAGITGIDMIPLEKTEWKHLEIVMPQQRVSEKLSVV